MRAQRGEASPPGGKSRRVVSGHRDIHRDLDRVVRRHIALPYRRPIGEVSLIAVDASLLPRAGRPLILDSGCGVDESAANIGERFRDAFGVGIDKSGSRLSRPKDLPASAVLVRANLIEAWRHLRHIGLERNWLSYPNPWSKIGRLSPLAPSKRKYRDSAQALYRAGADFRACWGDAGRHRACPSDQRFSGRCRTRGRGRLAEPAGQRACTPGPPAPGETACRGAADRRYPRNRAQAGGSGPVPSNGH